MRAVTASCLLHHHTPTPRHDGLWRWRRSTSADLVVVLVSSSLLQPPPPPDRLLTSSLLARTRTNTTAENSRIRPDPRTARHHRRSRPFHPYNKSTCNRRPSSRRRSSRCRRRLRRRCARPRGAPRGDGFVRYDEHRDRERLSEGGADAAEAGEPHGGGHGLQSEGRGGEKRRGSERGWQMPGGATRRKRKDPP